MSGKRGKEFAAGLKAGVPIVLGYIPVGIAFAIVARQAGLSTLQTCLMSLIVFAGASQIMAAGMVGQGAAVAAIVLATFLLNLRHIIMSMCVFNRLKREPMGLKLTAAFGITDESFALFTTGGEEQGGVWFFLGLVLSTYLAWNLSTLLGALVTELLPPLLTASLGVAIYALFLGLLLPKLPGNGRLLALVLLTAVCNTLLCRVMASSWALIISTLACAFAGVFFVDLGEEAQDGRR